MISIREVARLAGVSPATVSRVMNGTAKVDEEKAMRVMKVVKETGFIPNEVARSLYKKSSRIIGLVTPDIENPFFNHLAKAIENEAYTNGYRLTLCNTADNYEKEKANIQMLTRMNADGIILMTNNEEIQSEIDKCKIPVVVLDRQLPKSEGMVYIQSDHYQGGRMAAEHLIQCGCKNIVNIKGPQEYSSARARYRGYRDICKEYGIEEQCIECKYSYHDGLRKAELLLEEFPDVDGIIACNDMVAISVYKVLHKTGIKVPEQVQLIGFDNIDLGWIMTPELTTITQPAELMGRKAMEAIRENIDHKSLKGEYTFDVELIQRETTKGVRK